MNYIEQKATEILKEMDKLDKYPEEISSNELIDIFRNESGVTEERFNEVKTKCADRVIPFDKREKYLFDRYAGFTNEIYHAINDVKMD